MSASWAMPRLNNSMEASRKRGLGGCIRLPGLRTIAGRPDRPVSLRPRGESLDVLRMYYNRKGLPPGLPAVVSSWAVADRSRASQPKHELGKKTMNGLVIHGNEPKPDVKRRGAREILRFEFESVGCESNHHGCFRSARTRAKTLGFFGSQPPLG